MLRFFATRPRLAESILRSEQPKLTALLNKVPEGAQGDRTASNRS